MRSHRLATITIQDLYQTKDALQGVAIVDFGSISLDLAESLRITNASPQEVGTLARRVLRLVLKQGLWVPYVKEPSPEIIEHGERRVSPIREPGLFIGELAARILTEVNASELRRHGHIFKAIIRSHNV